MFAKKNIKNFFYLILTSHIIIWILIPSFTNLNLPLDTIEALAWGSNLDWGFNKHPPFSAFAVELFYQVFGNQDWAYYFLSQLFIISSFLIIFKLAIEFFDNIYLAVISLLLLEGIFFFNYTSPEFNVNISQLPFWALSILFTWRCIKNDKLTDYILLGIFMGLGFLSKYLFIYLISSITFLILYFKINKKIKSLNFLITAPVFLLIIFPHLIWLVNNDFITIKYGLKRTGEVYNYSNHFIFPALFIFKQFIILLPFFLMSFLLLKKISIKKFRLNEKMIFLIFTSVLPFLLILLTSILLGARIRTMWMAPFYLLAGVTFVSIFLKNIDLKKIKNFYLVFLFFFFISPTTYAIISLTNDFKRTDYPGKEIARLVQNRWDENFSNEIKLVIGDEWYAGNLSYHLSSRPKWTIELKKNSKNLDNNDGVIYTGNPKILKNICPGVYGTIEPVGYCMIGTR